MRNEFADLINTRNAAVAMELKNEARLSMRRWDLVNKILHKDLDHETGKYTLHKYYHNVKTIVPCAKTVVKMINAFLQSQGYEMKYDPVTGKCSVDVQRVANLTFQRAIYNQLILDPDYQVPKESSLQVQIDGANVGSYTIVPVVVKAPYDEPHAQQSNAVQPVAIAFGSDAAARLRETCGEQIEELDNLTHVVVDDCCCKHSKCSHSHTIAIKRCVGGDLKFLNDAFGSLPFRFFFARLSFASCSFFSCSFYTSNLHLLFFPSVRVVPDSQGQHVHF